MTDALLAVLLYKPTHRPQSAVAVAPWRRQKGNHAPPKHSRNSQPPAGHPLLARGGDGGATVDLPLGHRGFTLSVAMLGTPRASMSERLPITIWPSPPIRVPRLITIAPSRSPRASPTPGSVAELFGKPKATWREPRRTSLRPLSWTRNGPVLTHSGDWCGRSKARKLRRSRTSTVAWH